MLTLPLDPTDDRANPAFKNPLSCEQWLSRLQFTNLHAVHNLLRTQLGEFNRFPMRVLDRLNTLEKLRETVAIVQADYAKKLIAKKLPLSEEEYAIFTSIIGLWQGMLTGYQRCLQDFMEGDTQLEKHGVLLCHRFMLYGSLQIIEHLRSGYDFDGALWQQLHALYSFTEGNGLQHEKIKDELHGSGQNISCHTMYAKMLLTCHAKPSELTRTQLQLLDRWLTQWTDVITIDRRCVVSKGDAPPLAVDLRGNNGLQDLQQVAQSDQLRYLAMVPLSKLLRVKSILLQQGQSPQQLELGKEFYGVDCVAFLNQLLNLWCEGSSDRSAERHNVTLSAKVGIGFDLIYAYIANKPIKSSHPSADVDTAAHKQIATIGHTFTATNSPNLENLESWTIANESILGARLLRENKDGERIGNNQIIALRTLDAKAFMLGTVSWRSVALGGHLQMGVQYLPGVAQAVTLKIKDADSAQAKVVPALLLPAMLALKIPASLIVPGNIFQANLICELVQTGTETSNIKMGFSVTNGVDFERISFTQGQKQ
jgi:cyclic-di-GMP-binding protein